MTNEANEETGPSGSVSSSFHVDKKCTHDQRVCVECSAAFEGCSMQPKQQTCSKLCWNRHFRQKGRDTRPRKTTKKQNPIRGEERWCSACSEWKHLTAFQTASGNIQSRCKPCNSQYQQDWRLANLDRVRVQEAQARRRAYTIKKYGLTREEYEAIRGEADGCGICGGMPGNGKPLHLDHDHVTGKVRAFLCENCNRGLGMFQDSPERLRAAAEYLERYSSGGGVVGV